MKLDGVVLFIPVTWETRVGRLLESWFTAIQQEAEGEQTQEKDGEFVWK